MMKEFETPNPLSFQLIKKQKLTFDLPLCLQ